MDLQVAFAVANTAVKQLDLGDRDDQMAQVTQFHTQTLTAVRSVLY